jgi:hypothetical protein
LEFSVETLSRALFALKRDALMGVEKFAPTERLGFELEMFALEIN